MPNITTNHAITYTNFFRLKVLLRLFAHKNITKVSNLTGYNLSCFQRVDMPVIKQ